MSLKMTTKNYNFSKKNPPYTIPSSFGKLPKVGGTSPWLQRTYRALYTIYGPLLHKSAKLGHRVACENGSKVQF